MKKCAKCKKRVRNPYITPRGAGLLGKRRAPALDLARGKEIAAY